MTITEGTPVTAIESTGLTNVCRIGGPPGAFDGCWVLIAASHNRASASLQTDLFLSGPGTDDAVSAGAVNVAAGAHYAASWLVYVPEADNIPAVGETNPPDMWTITALQTSNGAVSNGDFAVAAFVLDGVMSGLPIDSTTPFAQDTTVTPTWLTADTTVDDSTIYHICATERDLAIAPAGSLVELAEVKSTNATVGRRTTLWVGKLHKATAGDPGDQTASLGATARQWRTFAFGLIPAGLLSEAGEDEIVPAGARVLNDGTGSAFATTYLWEQMPETGDPDIILFNADQAVSEFVAENETAVPIEYTLRLTVSDGTDTAEDFRVVTVLPPAVTAEGLEVRVCNGTTYV